MHFNWLCDSPFSAAEKANGWGFFHFNAPQLVGREREKKDTIKMHSINFPPSAAVER